MITDNKLYFADREAITTTKVLGKVLDLGVETSLPLRPFYLVLICHGPASNNVKMKLITCDATTPGTDFVEMLSTGTIDKKGLVRGAIYALPLPILPSGLCKRYLGVKLEIGGTADGDKTLADLCQVLEPSVADISETVPKAPRPVGEHYSDKANTFSILITDQIHEMKPWKFLDIAAFFDPTTAPAFPTVASTYMKSDFSNAQGALPIENGGTSKGTAPEALNALGAKALASKDKVDLTTDVEGILPTANGGTGSAGA